MQTESPVHLLPPAGVRRVPALQGLRWLQRGFRLFTAQPGRWTLLLGLWLGLSLLLPTVLLATLENVQQVVALALRPLGLNDTVGSLIANLPVLVPLAMVLLFPLVFSGLMVGCAAVAAGERLEPRHLFAAFSREPSRLVTVGGINLVGQILISQAIAWFVRDRVGDLDFNFPAGPGAAAATEALMTKLGALSPLVLPVVVLQTLLMAALWFTPPLLVFHAMTPLAAVRASLSACARNSAALGVYGLATILMLVFVGAVSLSAETGLVFALLALGVLTAAMTTVIASLYASYIDLFDPHG